MSWKIVFLASRPDTSKAFWYDSDEGALYQEVVIALKTEFESIPGCIEHHSIVYSEDQLEVRTTWLFSNVLYWNSFTSKFNTRLPLAKNERNQYFFDNKHKLSVITFDEYDNEMQTVIIP